MRRIIPLLHGLSRQPRALTVRPACAWSNTGGQAWQCHADFAQKHTQQRVRLCGTDISCLPYTHELPDSAAPAPVSPGSLIQPLATVKRSASSSPSPLAIRAFSVCIASLVKPRQGCLPYGATAELIIRKGDGSMVGIVRHCLADELVDNPSHPIPGNRPKIQE